jgi:hypothetical protein
MQQIVNTYIICTYVHNTVKVKEDFSEKLTNMQTQAVLT